MNMAKNFKIAGIVKYAGKGNEEKNTVTLTLSDERAKELIEKLELDNQKYESIPVKENEEGELFLKASSKYPVNIYDNGAETEDIALDDIGEGSDVTIFVGIDITTYKRKQYQVAYLKSVNVISLVESERFNPFYKESDVEEI